MKIARSIVAHRNDPRDVAVIQTFTQNRTDISYLSKPPLTHIQASSGY